jgi:hypothetical protein
MEGVDTRSSPTGQIIRDPGITPVQHTRFAEPFWRDTEASCDASEKSAMNTEKEF